jgi:hypothetical protein
LSTVQKKLSGGKATKSETLTIKLLNISTFMKLKRCGHYFNIRPKKNTNQNALILKYRQNRTVNAFRFLLIFIIFEKLNFQKKIVSQNPVELQPL